MEAKQTTYIAPEYHTLRIGDSRRVAGGLVEIKLVPCSFGSGDARVEVKRLAGPSAAEIGRAANDLLGMLGPMTGCPEEMMSRSAELRTLALEAIAAELADAGERGPR